MAGKKKTQQDATPSSSEKRSSAKIKAPVLKKASVEFSLKAPLAKKVSVAGTFNAWDVGASRLKKEVSGAWSASLSLAPGCYEYRFFVDGAWVNDPRSTKEAPNSFGASNSVVEVA